MSNVMKRALVGDACVVFSVDWFSGVFYNVPICYFFETFLPIPDPPYMNSAWVDTFSDQAYLNGTNRFDWNGIMVKYSPLEFALCIRDGKDPFRTPFKHLDIEVSGNGMRFLRKLFPDIDVDLRRLCVEASERDDDNFGFHPSRFDLAYDFFNYNVQDFQGNITNMYTAWKRYLNQDYMDDVTSLRSARGLGKRGNYNLQWEITTGKKRCINFGTDSTNEKLRIYDKMLERGGIHVEDLPFDLSQEDCVNIKSWHRIELQTRERKNGEGCCKDYFYCMDSDLGRLQMLVDRFTFLDPVTKEPLKWWQDWFRWDHIKDIIQNAKTVHFEDRREKLTKSYQRWLKSGVKFFSAFGQDIVLGDIGFVAQEMAKDPLAYSYRKYIDDVYVLLGSEFTPEGHVIHDINRFKKCPHMQLSKFSSIDRLTGEYYNSLAWLPVINLADRGTVHEQISRGFVVIEGDMS